MGRNITGKRLHGYNKDKQLRQRQKKTFIMHINVTDNVENDLRMLQEKFYVSTVVGDAYITPMKQKFVTMVKNKRIVLLFLDNSSWLHNTAFITLR